MKYSEHDGGLCCDPGNRRQMEVCVSVSVEEEEDAPSIAVVTVHSAINLPVRLTILSPTFCQCSSTDPSIAISCFHSK